MSRLKISLYSLRQVVDDLGPEFRTKDVSEDPRMVAAHLDLADRRNYHSFVGGALSDHDSELGIRKTDDRTERGVKWKKTVLLSSEETAQ